MVDRVIKQVQKGRLDAWSAFKSGLAIKGYSYYEVPENLKYRYPAPGSCPMDVADHPNLYKNDWKVPFRVSDYNISKVEKRLWDDDWEQCENYTSNFVALDAENKRYGEYDTVMLQSQEPNTDNVRGIYEGAWADLGGEDARKAIWEEMEDQERFMVETRTDFAPGQCDFNDDYNQVQLAWNNRGVTGMENSPRMKEMFVELEYWIEEVIGKPQIESAKADAYKGQPKKWQVLDDACFSRVQIEAMQAAVDAPAPEQLEMWREKATLPI